MSDRLLADANNAYGRQLGGLNRQARLLARHAEGAKFRAVGSHGSVKGAPRLPRTLRFGLLVCTRLTPRIERQEAANREA